MEDEHSDSVGVCVWLDICVGVYVWKSKKYINMVDYIFISLILPLYSRPCKKELPEQIN